MNDSPAPRFAVTDPGVARAFRVTDVALVLYVLLAGISTSLGQAMAILAVLAWLVGTFRGRELSGKFPLLFPHLAFGAASLLAALAAADVWAGLLEVRTEWVGYLLMVTAADRMSATSRAGRLLDVLIASGAVITLWALVQAVQEGVDYRVGASMGYMTYSEMLMLIVTVVLARTIFESTPRRAFRWLPLLALMIAALMLTQTRGAWLGAMAGALILVWIRDRRFLLLVPVVAVLFFFAAPEPVRQRLEGLIDLSDITANERVFMWRAGVAMVEDHPLTGVGPGNVREAWPVYRLPDDPWLEQRDWTHMHSNVVQVSVERGLLGLVTWLSIWVAWIVLAFRSRPRDDLAARSLWATGVAAVVAFQVAGLTEWNYGDMEVAYLIYFLMALPLVKKGTDLFFAEK